MEVAVFRCTVCGYNMMYGADQSSAFWLKEFRTIYSSKDKPEITGIGFHQDKGIPSCIIGCCKWSRNQPVRRCDMRWGRPTQHSHMQTTASRAPGNLTNFHANRFFADSCDPHIETSWGNERKSMAVAAERKGVKHDYQKLPMAPGTVITGLFATQIGMGGFTDLGLMTEKCPEKHLSCL
ncbi:hypothetical protein BST61_g1385 [Cercospora zeina]